jgi:hypothetical protein
MSWSYRIVKNKFKDGVRYAIHEAYYGQPEDDLKTGNIEELDRHGISWTENPVGAETFIDSGDVDNPEEQREYIRGILTKMLKACDYPMVDECDPKTYEQKKNMSLFVCDACGVIENTSLGRYWTKDSEYLWAEDNRCKALCSECAPLTYKSGNATKYIGKWHARFEKKIATEEDIKSIWFINR